MKIDKILNDGSLIFNPQAKIFANIDRVIEHIETGYTAPVLVEVDPSNACNHACICVCLSAFRSLFNHYRAFRRAGLRPICCERFAIR